MAARLLALALGRLLLMAPCVLAQDSPPLLTTARELRALSADDAKLPFPVHLTATVTLVEPGRTTFIRDPTGATFIRNTKEPLHTGQRIEVEGETYPGLYVTGIVAKRITVLGEGEPPQPLKLSFEQLASGQFHYEWVQVSGVVRTAAAGPDYPVLKLALGDGALDLYPVSGDATGVEHLVDASVTVVGLAAGFINDRRQLVAPHLRLRSIEDIRVTEPPPADPFGTTPISVSELLRFSPTARPGHRVKVRGCVIHQEAGVALYLRDGDQGLRVRTNTSDAFTPGEIVEALGFPGMGRLSAELEDAVVQRTGDTMPVPPIATTAKELLSGQRDADLVQLDGDIRDVVREFDRLTLVVQEAGTVFSALAKPCPDDSFIPPPGARVHLTGVCRVAETTQPARGFSTRARSFELLLRMPATDIKILRRPPWWTARRLSVAASALLGVAVLALAWIVMLRRQVRRQTALIRSQVEAAAIADERQRIAREFHDTLEQELVGVSLRLDAAATRAEETRLRDLLTATQRLVQQLQTGARSFVWNLRDTALATQPLEAAIASAVSNVVAGRELQIRTVGEARRIPETIAHELLRVAQEATANAVKHGGARHIAVTIEFSPSRVSLTVHDDGAGFDPETPVAAGHFGLIGMRERVQKLGGDFLMRSAPGTGATVSVTVPL